MKSVIVWISFVLIEGARSGCSQSDQFCLNCSFDTCGQCVASFLNSTSKFCQKPLSVIEACLTYKNDFACSTCQFGYFLEDGRCKSLTNGCAVLFNNGTCRVCQEGYLINPNGTCSGSNFCKQTRCRYCELTHGVETCVLCEEGFAVKYAANGFGTCVSLGYSNANCMVLAPDYSCYLCNVGYYYLNGTCIETKSYSITMRSKILEWLLLGIFGLIALVN